MASRYRAALALTLALAASLPPGAQAARHRHARHRAAPAATLSATDLYSRRALRRAKIILELKLMELRAKRLERVRKAIERNAPIEELLNGSR